VLPQPSKLATTAIQVIQQTTWLIVVILSTPALAQTSPATPPLPRIPPGVIPLGPPSDQPLPDPLPPLPADDLLPPAPPLPERPPAIPDVIRVREFRVIGSTVFSPEELAAVTAPFTHRDLTFAELLQARSAVTQLYVERGYITSGALIPPQTIDAGIVTIQVIEGSLEAIDITGTRRLNPSYVRQRLARATTVPLNRERLLQALQLLQLDPLIQRVVADLQAGTRLGTNVLQVTIEEADPFSLEIGIDNGRSPSVGSFRRQVQATHLNILGLGDRLSLGYLNTDGSHEINGSYTLPLNARNGTLRLSVGHADSQVIEPPFDRAGISAPSHYYELTLRQPLHQTPTNELALSLTASRQESQTIVDGFGPVPLSTDADEQGRTRVSALRFGQEWTQRSSQHVLAVRSQISLGVDWFDANVSDLAADSRFWSWRTQGQWVRRFAPETLLLIRADWQLASDALVAVEQFSIGGPQSVRGYRQDALLTDNGVLLSAELRLPVLRVTSIDGVLQVVPFLDVGTGWNHDMPPLTGETLVGVGVGLVWQQDDRLSARLDWGIPLVPIADNPQTWQENGIYFSVIYTLF